VTKEREKPFPSFPQLENFCGARDRYKAGLQLDVFGLSLFVENFK